MGVTFIKFVIVGFSGLFIDFGLTYLLKERFSINKFIANGVGVFFAILNNYFLNRVWTFASTKDNYLVEFTIFGTISLIGLGMNTLILYLVNKYLIKNFYFSKFITIVIVTFWNFLANFYFTFK